MARINLIPPNCLSDQHLIAEYREILAIYGYAKKNRKLILKKHQYCEYGIYKKEIVIPSEMLLIRKDGTKYFNHWDYFAFRIPYLRIRHAEIVGEMKRRGFKPTKEFPSKNLSIPTISYEKTLKGLFAFTKEDINFIKNRIIQRINEKPGFYRYYGHKGNAVDVILKFITRYSGC